ncbi:hypothetical protein VNO80_15727 [Phaseolus coccineus]|uniref:Uncharacterized protein n=1 Tax=Phaseolus coccineus TaxID=3886 RepID=A0AAN9MKU4_PHACN
MPYLRLKKKNHAPCDSAPSFPLPNRLSDGRSKGTICSKRDRPLKGKEVELLKTVDALQDCGCLLRRCGELFHRWVQSRQGPGCHFASFHGFIRDKSLQNHGGWKDSGWALGKLTP